MKAAKLNIVIPEDHRLELELPEDLPPGPAEVIVLVMPKVSTTPDRRAMLGMDRGKVWIDDDFDAPLPEDLQRAFEGDP